MSDHSIAMNTDPASATGGEDFETLGLVHRCRAGDREAEQLLFERYAARLLAMLSTRIPEGVGRRFGADDVAQSVFLSLYRAVRQDRIRLERSGDLWAWLLRVAFNKLSTRVSYHLAQARSVEREHLGDEQAGAAYEIPDTAASVEDIAAIADELDHLFGPPGTPMRSVVDLRLQDLSVAEIGARLGVSHTTICRQLRRIGEALNTRWEELEARVLEEEPVNLDGRHDRLG